MKNITDYINEVRVQAGPVEIEYTPKDWDGLLDAVRDVAKVQSNRKVLDFNCIDIKPFNDLRWLFYDALKDTPELLKKDLLCDKWDVSNVTSFANTFAKCKGFTGKGLEKWNVTARCEDMFNMFAETAIKKIDMTRWDMSGVKNIMAMFDHAKDVKIVKFPDSAMPKNLDMTETFLCCGALEYVKLPKKRMEPYTTYEAFAECGSDHNRLVIDNLDSIVMRRRDGKNLDTLYENTFRECGIESGILNDYIKKHNLSDKDVKLLGIDSDKI
jgi:hypothetical protein